MIIIMTLFHLSLKLRLQLIITNVLMDFYFFLIIPEVLFRRAVNTPLKS